MLDLNFQDSPYYYS